MNHSQQSSVLSQDKRVLYVHVTELKKALGYVFVLLGLPESQIPNKLAEEVLVNYIKTAFPNITVEDIKNAFHGAMSNNFLLDSGRPVNDLGLYGNLFSAEYFSKIVSAYLIWKRSQPVRQNAADAGRQLAQETPKTPEQEKAEKIKAQDNMLKFYENYVVEHGGRLPIVLDTHGLWSAIKRKGGFDLSDSKIEQVRIQAQERLMIEMNRLIGKGDKNGAHKIKMNIEHEERYEMKKVYVEEYLLSQIPTQ